MKYIIIGLGNYGEILARRLTELGHEVIGADNDKSRIDALSSYISGAICLDASNEEAIAMLPLDKADAVIVAIGANFAASVQTVAQLKQRGVKHIIARGLNSLHVGVLQTLGVQRVTYPENIGAETLAQSLSLAEFKSSYKIDPQHYIFQIAVPAKHIGQMVQDVGLEGFGLQLITIKEPKTVKNMLVMTHTEMVVIGHPTPTTELREGDLMVLYGDVKDFDAFSKSVR